VHQPLHGLTRIHNYNRNIRFRIEGWCLVDSQNRLEAFAASGLAERAAESVGRTGQDLITRAAGILLSGDSRASFEIESERAPRNRLERWGRAVFQTGKNELTLAEIVLFTAYWRLCLLSLSDP
jgi:hypothetical protein